MPICGFLATPTNIRQYAAEQKWNVSERNVYRYISAADKLNAKSVEKNRGKLLAFHHAARRALYARAMAVSDYGTASRVLKDEAELFGLYPPKQAEVNNRHEITDDQNAVNEFLSRRGILAPKTTPAVGSANGQSIPQ